MALQDFLSIKTDSQPSRFIPYCQHSIDDAEIAEIIDSLRSDWLTKGPKTAKFEEAFARYTGSAHAVAVSSCTAALHLALAAAGVKDGDEVITTPFTFCATAEVIEYQRARPVFVDIDPATFNIDPEQIQRHITTRTKAIIPVHYGGIPCKLDEINRIAAEYGLTVIEDAAHAAGTEYNGRKIGANGNPTAFSFYPTKNMTTGEGGVITSNDPEFASQIKVLSLHGISKDAWKRYSSEGQWYYEIHALGYKYNFTDLQAALGLHQLKKLDSFNAARERLARQYFDTLRGVPGIEMPEWYARYFNGQVAAGERSSWHLFVIMTTDSAISRDAFIEVMRKAGIGTSVHFIPLHLQPFYARKYGLKRGDFPVAEETYDHIISLPLYPKLSAEQLRYITDTVKEVACNHQS